MNLEYVKKNIWRTVDEKEQTKIHEYNEEYKNFLNSCKTERNACKYIIQKAKEHGFIALDEALKKDIQPGEMIYLNNKNKSVVLLVMGEDIHDGLHIVGAHLDSPRLDIKANPLYEADELCMMRTHYYGGIKKYQWTTIPLSLHGVLYNKNGEEIEIHLGDHEDEPVFFINDLLAHLSKDLNEKSLGAGIEGERLHLIVGHNSYAFKDEKENPVKKSILKYLHDHYHIEEEDFLLGELEAVPANNARDVGFDRSMIMAHGHDDRVCSFATLDAMLQVEHPKITAVGLFVDKEEIGSVGNTSMSAPFFKNMIAEIINAQGDYNDLYLRRILAKSKVLSADVTTAVDPLYPEATEKQNTGIVGCGVTLSKYTGARGKSGSNDANAEFLNELRQLFEIENIIWQTGEFGKVDQGGAGTIAYILANDGCEVVDLGTPMLSMHAPLELLSKADSYMTMKAYYAFLK